MAVLVSAGWPDTCGPVGYPVFLLRGKLFLMMLAYISLSLQSKLEDIRLDQEKEAEKMIRLHFQMEQIIYCQDQVYRGALQKVREKEAEEEKNKTKSSSSFSSQALQNSSMAEIFQHLNAYRQVSVWTP